ncbi:MAG: tRNA-binding protein [Anaerolineae bacterium]
MTELATYDDFQKLEMRVGEIVEVQDFPRARNPSYKVRVNFGADVGERWSSVQATNYSKDELIGRQVIGVVNFPPKNIAGFQSECLILGVPGVDGKLSLLVPSRPADLSGRVY